MEGIAGIVRPEQTNAGEPLYEEGRKLYTQEINAAVRGAKAGGATEIVVMDCHGAGKGYSFNSLLPEGLEAGALRPEGGAALRSGQAVRDQGRVQVDGTGGEPPIPRRSRAARCSHARLPRRRLVDGVEAVLPLRRG